MDNFREVDFIKVMIRIKRSIFLLFSVYFMVFNINMIISFSFLSFRCCLWVVVLKMYLCIYKWDLLM